MPTVQVAGLVGSLRERSYNRALLRAAMTLQPEGMEIVDVDLRSLPHYDDDLEQAGESDAIREFKVRIAAADALLFVTPEYNYSIPGILKDGESLESVDDFAAIGLRCRLTGYLAERWLCVYGYLRLATGEMQRTFQVRID